MSIDATSFNRKLSQVRSQYRNAADELKNSYDKNTKDLEKLHAKRSENQLEAFKNQKGKIEQDHEKNKDYFVKKSKADIGEIKKNFQERLGEERSSFHDTLVKSKTDFGNRIDDLSRSFRTAAEDREKVHKALSDSSKNKYKSNLDKAVKDFDSKVKSIETRADGNIESAKNKWDQEKRDLNISHRKENQKVVQDSNLSKYETRNKLQKEMELLREGHDSSTRSLQNNHESSMRNLRNNHERNREIMGKEFQNASQRLEERNREEIDRLSKENKLEMRKRSKEFNQDRLSLERKTHQLINAGSPERAKNRIQRIEESFENRFKNVRNKMDQQNFAHALEKEKMLNSFNNEHERQQINLDKELENRESKIRELETRVIGKLKDDHQKTVENYQKKIKKSDLKAEEGALLNKKISEQALKKERASFSKNIQALENNNQKIVSELRKDLAKEQGNFIESARRKHHHERQELVSEMNNKFNYKVTALEEKINNLEDNRIKLINQYEEKLKNLQSDANNKAKDSKIANEERRLEDQKAFRHAFDSQRMDFQASLKKIRANFDKQLQKTKFSNERKMTETVSRYEKMLRDERMIMEREMKRKISHADNEYLRLKKQQQTDLAAMKAQYELKMEKLRQANASIQQKHAESSIS